MDTSSMLHSMVHDVLSNADLNAIRKSRGLSKQETASRALFESAYLSDIGVEAALATLSLEERTMLHLLCYLDKPVDITPFERVYAGENRPQWFSTFTQRYQDVYKQVRASLVRRGVLLVAEDVAARTMKKTKMERWLLRFPEQFKPFLPPPFGASKTFDVPGKSNEDPVREQVLRILGSKPVHLLRSDRSYDLLLRHGTLYLGMREFRAAQLEQWRQDSWAAAVPALDLGYRPGYYVPPVEAAVYAFSQLKPDQWISPGQLSVLLKVFCGAKHPAPLDLCEAGWQSGCLARHSAERIYYRLAAPAKSVAAIAPSRYLQPDGNRRVLVDLRTIPYDSLEQVVRIADLQVERGQLTATPNLIKMGRTPDTVRNHPVVRWLHKHAPAFGEALDAAEQRWGRIVVHSNLMVARINDLSLKVALQKAYADSPEVVFLPDDYIAFPKDWLANIERQVNKAGCVVKKVALADV